MQDLIGVAQFAVLPFQHFAFLGQIAGRGSPLAATRVELSLTLRNGRPAILLPEGTALAGSLDQDPHVPRAIAQA